MSTIVIHGHNFVKALLDSQSYGPQLIESVNAYLAYLTEQAEFAGHSVEVDNSDGGEGAWHVEAGQDSAEAARADAFMRERVEGFWRWHQQSGRA
ncbi:hypothetical protein [Crenobacter intestini]|uniref:Uncharacterized protein n=1 Tax=Crenobacter intestini TaxID=2563443 RepID=A0A4T0V6D9_9NEIS|nr:hypothetical protein [Crenobacter intestini]TIC86906.1 hypothetical protein E5K04_00385 [Crenobacter intestini]